MTNTTKCHNCNSTGNLWTPTPEEVTDGAEPGTWCVEGC